MSTSDPNGSHYGNSAYSSPSADAAAQPGGYPGDNAVYPRLPAGSAGAYQQPDPQGAAFQGGYWDPNAAAIAQAAAMGRSPKSKVAAGVMALLIGSLGIHNFYLGNTGRGVAQLLISLLSCGILAGFVAIWGIVEGVLILTAVPGTVPWGVDAEGVPLTS
ncbi:TM2 domain-containing protein [Actinomyces trachealis]|uniref:TM2 domain-containing protein n=1 Tax=Actinomyces trachealis TaxID=2763540 RepID=UPI001FD1ED1D|nr:TM2 domain-containing protein [Actinomyces trachealis]